MVDKSADAYWYKVKKDAIDGWASHKWLTSVAPNVEATEQFPWMPIALAEIGTKELDGNGNNPRILSYPATTTLDTSAAERGDEETPWCSAFVNRRVEKGERS